MKRIVASALLAAFALSLTACGGGGGGATAEFATDIDTLVSEYGFQWTDPDAPILNEAGSEAISFNVYSSKNASALDYNDMKIMQDLHDQTNVTVNWENVSESVYGEQKNLIFGNVNDRPDAIYHAGMSAGEIIRSLSSSAKRFCIRAARSSARRAAIWEFSRALVLPAASLCFKSAALKSQYWISAVRRSFTALVILSSICCLCWRTWAKCPGMIWAMA